MPNMDYNNQSDSSGTDDDLPPKSNRPGVGRPSGNGRAAGGSSYGRPQTTVTADQQIRKLELDAYTAVLQAFGAQSEVITWAKERLMSDLRKELEVPDEQHRELLRSVMENEAIKQIRDWKRMEESQPTNAQSQGLLEPSPSPAVSQSRKKQKTGHVAQSLPILALPGPPLLLKPGPVSASPLVPSLAPSKRGVPVGPRGKKSKGGRQAPLAPTPTPIKAIGAAAPSMGRGSTLGRGPAPVRTVMTADTPADTHLGRKVKTRWPDDNTFYEAVISDYDQEKDMHALVYDMGTTEETWEWVNLKEMSESDMKWVGGPPISLVNKGAPTGPPSAGRGSGRGMKRGVGARGGSVSAAGRARGGARGQAVVPSPAIVPISQTRSWRGPANSENGLERKGSRTLQIPVLEPLLKEAENLKDITDLERLESLRRKAKAHEEALRSALTELGESSEEAESDDGAHGPSSHTRSVDRERLNRSLPGSRDRRDDTDEEEDTAGDGRGEGSDGEHMAEEGGGVSDGEQHLVEEEDEDG